MPELIINLLKAIPDVVWGVIIGSLLTLLGVWQNNRESTERLELQLAHDSEQRDRERQMSLRREVYLQASEAITRTHSLLSRLCDLDIPDRDFSSEYQRDAGIIAKVQVVGADDTVQAIFAFSTQHAVLFSDLFFERLPLIARKKRIEALEIDIQKLTGEREDKRLAGLDSQRQALWIEQVRQHIDFTRLCLEYATRLSVLIPPALFAARAELELPLNEERYMQGFERSLTETKKAMEGTIKKIEGLLNS